MVRSLRREGPYDGVICVVGMGSRIQCHGGLGWLCGNGADIGREVSWGPWGFLVEDLVKALDMFKVPAQEKGELLGLLGPMKKGIVETP